jgi:N-acetylneuraminic acid mutarotase
MQGSSARRIVGAVSAAYRSISVLALIGVLGALAGCWDSSTNDNAAPSTPQLTSISVSPPDSSVAAGLAQILTATGIYSDGSKQDISSSVTWTSSGTAIATINTGGKAAALSTGSTTITATDGAIAGSTTLTVTSAHLVSIGVTPAAPSVAAGTTEDFKATGVYSDNSVHDLTDSVSWQSATPTVAPISSAGQATASSVGATIITATFGGVTSSGVTLSVTAATLVSMVVTPATATIAKGTQQQFTATGMYSDRSTQNLSRTVTWNSSAPIVATIGNASGSSGLAKATGVGTTSITAAFGGVTSPAVTLTVSAATLASIAVTPALPSVALGFNEQLSATGTYTDNSTQDLTSVATWTSSATAVAAVSSGLNTSGLVTSHSVGSTNITATLGAVSSSPVALTVTAMPIWTTTGNMNTARALQTATLLPNGTVLVAGGDGSNGFPMAAVGLTSAEIYDPSTSTWTATGSMTTGRYSHTATLLPNGTVLVAGGYASSGYVASAEIYDPSTGLWTITGSMNIARYCHTATLLPNGTVLVAAGYDYASGSLSASAEIYDPSTGIWTATGNLTTVRYYHTATLLPNGTVLVAGGYDINGGGALASTEIYDPTMRTWAATGSLNAARVYHSANLLLNGTVLVAGGQDSSGMVASAEIYDPSTSTWIATGSLNTALGAHTAVLLPNGTVLVAGGVGSSALLASAEIYDSGTSTWVATGSLNTARYSQTANLLPDGTVLVAGGYGSSGALASAEIY